MSLSQKMEEVETIEAFFERVIVLTTLPGFSDDKDRLSAIIGYWKQDLDCNSVAQLRERINEPIWETVLISPTAQKMMKKLLKK